MRRLLQRFRDDTDGAVTVDWIVLTVGVIALAAGAGSLITDGTQDGASNLSSALEGMMTPTETSAGVGGQTN